jgi:cytochrome b561
MPLRNRPEGYGTVSRTLHWATVAALLAQLSIGYLMDWDDGGSGRGRGRGRGGGSGRGRGRGGDDDSGWSLPDLGDDALLTVHVLLGLTIIGLGLARWAWRRADSLPAWAEQLTDADKRLAHWTERALLTLLLLVPATGIALVLSGDDDLLPLHVAAHVAFYVALAAHLFLVLRRRLLRRMLTSGAREPAAAQAR